MIRLITIFVFYMCSLWCLAQVTINPLVDRTSFEVLHPHVDKVEFKEDSTKVYCSLYYQKSFGYNIPKTMFIEDTKTNKKYQITKCIGLPFEPEERVFDYGGTYQFVFCFPYIKDLHKFNLIEDPSKDRFFNIYGIDMSNKYSKVFKETEYKHFKNMSDFYKSSGDINKFVEFEKEELSSAQYLFGMRSFAAGICYMQLAHYYNEVGDYRKAIDLGIQALECDSIQFGVENKEYPVYVNTLGSLSEFYLNAGKETESLHCLQKCIRIRRNTGDEKGYLNELFNLLHTGHSNDGILKKIAIVNQELETLPNFIEITSLPIASLYKQIGILYSLIDDNNNAIKYCNKALAIMDGNRHNDKEDYAEILGLKCKYQQRSGLKDEAISSGTAAKQLYESLDIRSLKYAELLGDLAWTYGLALNYEKSIQLQTIAAKIYENAKAWISLAEAYYNISHYYQSAENLDEAEQNIKKAIDVLSKHDNAQQYINDEVELTGNNMINNSFTLASINKRINTDKWSFLQTLARIYQKKGDLKSAINTELKNETIINSIGDDQLYALHLLNLSDYDQRNQQQNEAITCAEKCVQLLTNDNGISRTLPKLQLAIICFQAGDTAKAIHYAEESVFGASQSINDKESTIAAQSVLSYFYWKKRDYGRAEQFLSEELDSLISFISNELTGMTTEQKQRLWSKYEYNFILYRNIAEKSNKDEDIPSKLYNYVLFSKSLLLDTDIQRDANRMKITWKDIQQQMSDEDIAIEFISTIEENGNYNTYHALVLDKNNPCPRMITLYSETELEKIKKATTRNISDIVGELIWKPILAQYNNAKNIYFSPDGILHILPIEYYNVNSTTNMFEQYNMYRLSSTKELVCEYNHKQFNSAVLYGGLDYNIFKEAASETRETNSEWRGIAERGGFDPLTNTLVETQEIRDLLERKNISTTLYTGDNGTEERFLKLSNQNHSIIHLATHGMYVNPTDIDTKKAKDNFDFLEKLANTNDPVKENAILTHSFLVMAGGNRLVTREPVSDSNNDGILTSKEISKLNLSGLDLVVLSACESALGDIDYGGVYGLQRGFKKAGANTILMSLDRVDDEATQILMVEFYRNLLEGKSKRQSLKDSQNHLRQIEKGKYDDPKYWASFIMLDGLN